MLLTVDGKNVWAALGENTSYATAGRCSKNGKEYVFQKQAKPTIEPGRTTITLNVNNPYATWTAPTATNIAKFTSEGASINMSFTPGAQYTILTTFVACSSAGGGFERAARAVLGGNFDSAVCVVEWSEEITAQGAQKSIY